MSIDYRDRRILSSTHRHQCSNGVVVVHHCRGDALNHADPLLAGSVGLLYHKTYTQAYPELSMLGMNLRSSIQHHHDSVHGGSMFVRRITSRSIHRKTVIERC